MITFHAIAEILLSRNCLKSELHKRYHTFGLFSFFSPKTIMALLKDHQFNELCKLLKISGLHPNDSDKKTIEKAFRRLALKTHPDKGGDPIEFKKINEAYNKLIGHVTKLDAMEAEAELSRTSVIIEISKQAVPKWKEKLKGAYGLPKSQAKVNNVLFNVS